MGRHERPDQTEYPQSFRGTFRLVSRLPVTFLFGLLAILVALAILAVQAQNKYGDIWGAVISAGIAPLVGSIVLKTMLGARRRRGRR